MGYCLKNPEVYTELISDSYGLHVHTDMQQLILHCKGLDRTILVTDSTKTTYPNPPHLAYITDLNFDLNGDLGGSKLTMNQACRNIMTHTTCGIAQAFLMASRNPARVLGMDDEIGTIAVGKKANLVILDDRFNIKQVLFEGELYRFHSV